MDKLNDLIERLQDLKNQHGNVDVMFEFGIDMDFYFDGDFLHIGSPEAITELKEGM